ncbi:MAG: rhodanese-like domain-containing protein [Candidatus Pacebacteria bacterium]|nr:rhodanese-like domain-containing protein [Candidatus Paceibacterota bacterium]
MKLINKKYIGFLSVFVFILIAGALLVSGDTKVKQPVSIVQTVKSSEFINLLADNSNAILLDVRTPEEYDSGHIKGATNIDFRGADFVSEIQKLDKSKTYFVYCRSGNRSADAVQIMKENGINNIIELDGGIVSAPELLN